MSITTPNHFFVSIKSCHLSTLPGLLLVGAFLFAQELFLRAVIVEAYSANHEPSWDDCETPQGKVHTQR